MYKAKIMRSTKTFLQKGPLIISGIFFAIVIIEIGLRLGGLAAGAWHRQCGITAVPQKTTIKVLCIGDSHTWGFGSGSGESYPSQLETLLNKSSLGTFAVINAGIPGMNSALIAEELEKKYYLYMPDIVVINGGSNNCWNTTNIKSKDRAKPYFDFFSRLRVCKLIRILWLSYQRLYCGFIGKPRMSIESLTKDKRGNLFTDHFKVIDGKFCEVIRYRGHPDNQDNQILWGDSEALYKKNYVEYLKNDFADMVMFLYDKRTPVILQTYLCNDEGSSYRLANDAIVDFGNMDHVPVVRNDGYIKNNGYMRDDLLIPDGHPNAKGYRIMAENTYRSIVDLLK